MKRYVQILGMTAFACAPFIANAQTSSARQFSLGVSAGASFPIGEFGKSTGTGYSLAGHAYFMPASMASLGFRGDVSYDHWSFNGLVGSTGSNGSVHALGVAANALVRTTSPTSVIHPYLIGGVGFYNTKASYGSLASSGNTNIGVQGGGGAEFMLSGFTTFAEVKVVNIFSKSSNGDGSSSTRFVPLTFGVRF